MIGTTGNTGAGRRHVSGRCALRFAAALLSAALVSVAAPLSAPPAAATESAHLYGPFGPEGPRLREQLWILPSTDRDHPLRATVFRPADEPGADGAPLRRSLVVINHGTSDATRLAVAMPVYYWLSRWFVERGYVVVLPQRRGHGATGGPMAESVGSCADPDHYRSGLAAAEDIESAANFMSAQPFVVPGEAVVVGISSGGWASLALASRNPRSVRAVINIAGGRGGRPFGQNTDAVCGEKRLLDAARAFGETANVPTLWLYAANDSYFRPRLARAMAKAWQERGGKAELHVFPPYGSDGHNLADDQAGWDIWGTAVEHFLDEARSPPVVAMDPAPLAPEEATASAATTAASDGETRAP